MYGIFLRDVVKEKELGIMLTQYSRKLRGTSEVTSGKEDAHFQVDKDLDALYTKSLMFSVTALGRKSKFGHLGNIVNISSKDLDPIGYKEENIIMLGSVFKFTDPESHKYFENVIQDIGIRHLAEANEFSGGKKK